MEGLNVLVVEDDLLQARVLKTHLERPGRIRVDIARSGEEALDCLHHERVDAVLTDLLMPQIDGIELTRRIRETRPALPIVIMTALPTVHRAVESMRAGATDFLPKPIDLASFMSRLGRALPERGEMGGAEPDAAQAPAAARQTRGGIAGPLALAPAFASLTGDHPKLHAARDFARLIAGVRSARVLITGESGTGKSLLARMIHELSGAAGPLIEVNCAALPPQLLESELFGYERGAFTDAKVRKLGLIELADGGSLLLDEIGAMPLELQAKLLLFLESRQIRRLGGVQSIPVRTRVLALTNDDLRARVRERAFRQDLLYRLDVASFEMPALRKMPSIILDLANHFVVDLAAELKRKEPGIAEQCLPLLLENLWPGNVRELRNAVERAMIFQAEGPLDIRPSEQPGAAPAGPPGITLPLGLSLQQVERHYLNAILASHAGQLGDVASELGISRKTLWEKRRRYGLE